MRTSGINIKPTGFSFTRTLINLDKELSKQRAEASFMRPKAVVVHASRLVLSDAKVTKDVIAFTKEHHGPNTICVFYLRRRAVERTTCLPGVMGELIAS